MKTFKRFIQGLFFGLVAGGIIALLFAPKEGSELRKKIVTRFQEMSHQFKQAADQKKAELEEEINQYLKRK